MLFPFFFLKPLDVKEWSISSPQRERESGKYQYIFNWIKQGNNQAETVAFLFVKDEGDKIIHGYDKRETYFCKKKNKSRLNIVKVNIKQKEDGDNHCLF